MVRTSMELIRIPVARLVFTHSLPLQALRSWRAEAFTLAAATRCSAFHPNELETTRSYMELPDLVWSQWLVTAVLLTHPLQARNGVLESIAGISLIYLPSSASLLDSGFLVRLRHSTYVSCESCIRNSTKKPVAKQCVVARCFAKLHVPTPNF